MNEKQRKVLIAVLVVVVVMLLMPPYVIKGYGSNANVVMVSGYSLIFELPPRATVDVLTLVAQWLGISICGAIAFFIAKDK